MQLQYHTLTTLITLIILITLLCPIVVPQSHVNITNIKHARELDALLQTYAYSAFNYPKTGIVYNAIVPNNLSGIRVSALRLRTGSLFTRGVVMYKEFNIPTGVIARHYVERLVLVYQNLGNRSRKYYYLPGYMYLSPVLGLLAYDGSDLLVKKRAELDIQASDEAISIDFGAVGPAAGDGLSPMCVWVDLYGQVNFSNVVSGNRCLAFKQGHFSIVVKLKPSPPSVSPSLIPHATSEKHGGIDSRVWEIVVYVVGGCVLLVMLAVLVVWIRGYEKRKKARKMEYAAEGGEPLHMTMIGGIKAPAAMVTRTQPTLETEYVP